MNDAQKREIMQKKKKKILLKIKELNKNATKRKNMCL